MWLSVANLPKGPLRDPNESGGRPVDNVGLSIQQGEELENWIWSHRVKYIAQYFFF